MSQTLQAVVEQELFRCLARQLDRAPRPEDLPFTIQVMVEDLRTHGLRDEDAPRVADAFRRLGPTLSRWPTAPAVIAALPKHADAAKRLTHQESAEDVERRRRIAEKARALANTLRPSYRKNNEPATGDADRRQ